MRVYFDRLLQPQSGTPFAEQFILDVGGFFVLPATGSVIDNNTVSLDHTPNPGNASRVIYTPGSFPLLQWGGEPIPAFDLTIPFP